MIIPRLRYIIIIYRFIKTLYIIFKKPEFNQRFFDIVSNNESKVDSSFPSGLEDINIP